MNKLKNGFIVVLLGSYALTGLVAATEAYNNSRLQMKVNNFISKFKKSWVNYSAFSFFFCLFDLYRSKMAYINEVNMEVK